MHNVPHWNCDSPDTREEGLRNKPLIPVFSRILSSNLEEWLYHSHRKTGNQCLVKIQGHNFLGVPLSTHSLLVATPPQPCLAGAGSWSLGFLTSPQAFPARCPVTGSEPDQQGCERRLQGFCVSRER